MTHSSWNNRNGFSSSRNQGATDAVATPSDVTASNESAASDAISSTHADTAAQVGSSLPQLTVNDTVDHIVNSSEATAVQYTVSGLDSSGTVTFKDASNHEVTASISGNGVYTADLSSLTDGKITSSVTTGDAGHTNSVSGNTISLETDKDLNPSLSVDASNPSHVTFSISGFQGDEKGSITFTDSLGHESVVNVGSNGNYSTDLSSLAPGKITYLLTETDPAGNTISIDPPTLLGGDGSAGAPGGTPQRAGLLDDYATRPSWQVAGVDYAVGVTPGTTLKVPTANNLPPGATLGSGPTIYVDGKDVSLNGYDLTHYTVMINSDASGTVTISNCAATTGVNIRSTVDAKASVVVQNCTLDGGGMASDPDFQLIKVWTPLTVEYSVIKNAPAAIYAGGGQPLTVLYNEMEGFAWSNGAHANAIYVTGGNNPSASTTIAYNTIYTGASQNAQGFPIGIGAAIAFFDDGGNFYNSTVNNNTVISDLPGGASYLIGFYVGQGHSATGGVVQDNYVASINGFGNNSGAFGAFYAGSSGTVQATYTNNIDMNNGKVISGTNAESGSGSTGGNTGTTTSPPVIDNYSTDSGVKGDGITNDNTVTLTGKAAANSTIKIYDGTTQIGSATADGSGAWTYTTAALQDGAHKLSATATSSGKTSASSTALSVTIDTVAPNAPAISSSTASGNGAYLLKGTAEASSTVNVFDGTSQVGTVKADASGAWSYTVSSLSVGTHSLTAKAVDVAGNTSTASAAVSAVVSGSGTTGPTDPAGPSAPTIASVSNDTGVAGDGITSDNTLELKGTAAANSTVTVYDGSTKLGTVKADASGSWDYITQVLTDAKHVLTATATNASGQTSSASAATNVTVDTKAPTAPVEVGDSVVNTNHVLLNGTAEAGSTITIYDGTTVVGTATTGSNGTWTVTTSALSSGAHDLTATATDVAGNVSALSQPLDPVIPGGGGSTPTKPAAPVIAKFSDDSGVAGDHITNDNTLTLTGTAVANGTVTVLDGSKQLGTAKVDASGNWTLSTSALADGTHNLTATVANGGQTSAASTAMSVTIDTKVDAPVISSSTASGTDAYVLKGTAEANSTVSVFDGSKQLGTIKADASGAWSYTASSLSAGTHSLTAKAVDVAGNTSAASTAVSAVVSGSGPSGPTAPAAPVIAKFSDDSGVAGDHITNDNTLTLTGTAVANGTVTVMDGSKQLGTARVDASGNWTLSTSALADGTHNLTATVANGGQTSAASTAMSVTIDTKVDAPVISSSRASGTDAYVLKGTAEANSTVSVFDGSKQLGSIKADATGAWSYKVSSLSAGTHSLTAKAVDVAGNTSAASAAVSAVVSGSGSGPTNPTGPSAPTIAKFSNDSGVAGDNITNDTTLTLTGAALANSTIKVFDGLKQVGTTKVDDSGHWTLTTSSLSDGTHKLTATDTDSHGHTSAASSALSVTIDSHAPGTPTMGVYSQGGSQVGHTTTSDDLMLKGTAEANSSIKIFDAGKQIGTATTNDKGAWTYDTGHLADGNHSFTATAIDVAGNASHASAAKGVMVNGSTGGTDPTGPTASLDFTDVTENSNHTATIKGTGDAFSQIKLFDGNHAVGSVKVGADGTWSYTTDKLYCGVHTFKASEVDSSGHTVDSSSGRAVIGSDASNKLFSTSGNDVFAGNGHGDTFVFAANFGNDIIKDFAAGTKGNDTIQFSKSVFDNFASVLSHASQVGHDVVISTGNDSLTLKNTKIGALNSHDFHFA